MDLELVLSIKEIEGIQETLTAFIILNLSILISIENNF